MNLFTFLALFALSTPILSSPIPFSPTSTSSCLTVDPSSSTTNTYQTIASALASLGSSTAAACIYITSGTYNEQLTIDYAGNLTIYGETTNTGAYEENTVTITHTISSPESGSLISSATVDAESDGLRMYNVNVENGYGAGAQAVALVANGNRQGYYGCQFKGYQDTLYTRDGVQYFKNCYIEGAVDYIFGAASIFITNSTIVSTGAGYITASSREVSTDTSWYAIDNSVVRASGSSDLTGKVYLGRPWRVLARVIYQDSELGALINAKGWTTMAEGATPLYYEVGNTGDGADTSAREYESYIGGAVSKETVLGNGWEGWVDEEY